MAERRGRLMGNVMWLYGLQGINYLVPLLLLPYLVRVLGVERYGLAAFAQAVAQYFILATDYGFNFSATRSAALRRDDRASLERLFCGVTAIKLGLTAAGAVLLGAVVATRGEMRAEWAVYAAAYVAVVGNALFPVWLFQGLERMEFISILSGVAKLAGGVAVFALVRGPSETALAVLLQSCGVLAAGAAGASLALARYVPRLRRPRWSELVKLMRDGRHLFVSSASITLYTNTNTFLAGLLGGNREAGYFSLADKLIRAVVGLIFPFLQAAYPVMVRRIAESRESALRFFRRSLRISLPLAMLAGMVLFVVSGPLARAAFGARAEGVVPVLQVVSFFPPLAVGCASMGMLRFLPFGHERRYSKLLLAVGVGNVLLGCLLIPAFGARGAACSMVLMEAAQLAGGAWLLPRCEAEAAAIGRAAGEVAQ